jgi:hypothetical protein
MEIEFNFVVTESLKSVVQATGINTIGLQLSPCPLQAGDVISHPSARGIFFRVTGRWFAAGDDRKPARWYLLLEQADDPLAALDAKA